MWVCTLCCPALILYQLLTLYQPLHPITWIQGVCVCVCVPFTPSIQISLYLFLSLLLAIISDWFGSILSFRSIVFGSLYTLTLSLTSILYSLTCTGIYIHLHSIYTYCIPIKSCDAGKDIVLVLYDLLIIAAHFLCMLMCVCVCVCV